MNVKILCLGILSFGKMTGYDIRKLAFEGRFSHFCEAGYGSIYPALSQLTEAGHVTFLEEVENGKPARKIYSITAKGLTALKEAIATAPGADRFKSEFLFHSLFADIMSDEFFEERLEAKILATRDTVERLKSSFSKCDHEPSRFALGFGVAINEAALTYLENYDRNQMNESMKSPLKDEPQTHKGGKAVGDF